MEWVTLKEVTSVTKYSLQSVIKDFFIFHLWSFFLLCCLSLSRLLPHLTLQNCQLCFPSFSPPSLPEMALWARHLWHVNWGYWHLTPDAIPSCSFKCCFTETVTCPEYSWKILVSLSFLHAYVDCYMLLDKGYSVCVCCGHTWLSVFSGTIKATFFHSLKLHFFNNSLIPKRTWQGSVYLCFNCSALIS